MGISAPENLSAVLGAALSRLLATVGWFYVLVAFMAVDLDGREPADVARQFLQQRGPATPG